MAESESIAVQPVALPRIRSLTAEDVVYLEDWLAPRMLRHQMIRALDWLDVAFEHIGRRRSSRMLPPLSRLELWNVYFSRVAPLAPVHGPDREVWELIIQALRERDSRQREVELAELRAARQACRATAQALSSPQPAKLLPTKDVRRLYEAIVVPLMVDSASYKQSHMAQLLFHATDPRLAGRYESPESVRKIVNHAWNEWQEKVRMVKRFI